MCVCAIRQENGELLSTPFVVMVGKFSNWRTIIRSRQGRRVSIRNWLSGKEIAYGKSDR